MSDEAAEVYVERQRFQVRENSGHVRLVTDEGLTTDEAQAQAQKHADDLAAQQPERSYVVEAFRGSI